MKNTITFILISYGIETLLSRDMINFSLNQIKLIIMIIFTTHSSYTNELKVENLLKLR